MPDPTYCVLCANSSRRSHAGVLICPICDLNELPATPTPKVMPQQRRPPVTDKET